MVENTTYDSLGRKTQGRNTKGEISEYLYEDASYPGNLTALKLHHGDGKVTEKTFDYAGGYNAFATTITEHYTEDGIPKTNVTSKTYEFIRGNLLTSQDHVGHTTSYENDTQGRLVKIIRPSARGETGEYILEENYDYEGSFVYEELYNQVVFKLHTYTTKTDGQGTQTIAEANTYYDDHGNVLLSQYYDYDYDLINPPTNVNRTYGYNSYGQLIWTIDPYEKQTSYNIDGWGRLIDVTDAAENKQTIEYDIYNRTKTAGFIPHDTTNMENNYTEEYDQWGRITVRKGYPDGIENPNIQESYEYDLVGNLIKVTDPNGNSTRFHYDPLNRIKRVTNPLGETIDVDYDRLGNLTKLNQYEGSNTFTTRYMMTGVCCSPKNPPQARLQHINITAWVCL